MCTDSVFIQTLIITEKVLFYVQEISYDNILRVKDIKVDK